MDLLTAAAVLLFALLFIYCIISLIGNIISTTMYINYPTNILVTYAENNLYTNDNFEWEDYLRNSGGAVRFSKLRKIGALLLFINN